MPQTGTRTWQTKMKILAYSSVSAFSLSFFFSLAFPIVCRAQKRLEPRCDA